MEPILAMKPLRTLVQAMPWPEKMPKDCNQSHIIGMINKIEEGEVTGEKAHRWLGWIQGVLCMMGVSRETFDNMNAQANWKLPSALEAQEGGSHYKGQTIQPVEYMHANKLDYNRAAVVKYVTRDKVKGGIEDVKKAIHFCRFILEQDYGVRSSNMTYEVTRVGNQTSF